METKVAITGGAGFLGAHVAKHCLELGFNVVVIDNLSGGFEENIPVGCDFINGDICDHDLINSTFEKHRFDYVYHLAADARENLSPHIKRFNYMNNVVGSVNIINACINYDVKCLVFTSSIATMAGNKVPYEETDPLEPQDSYGNAKMIVELELHQSLERFGLPFIIFRPFNIYGPLQNIGDKYRNVVGIFMNQIMNGEPLTVFGDGEQKRSFSFIDDVAPHIAKSVLRKGLYNQTFFIGGSQQYSVNELVRVIGKTFQVNPHVKYLEERMEVKVSYADTTKARQAFGRDWTTLNQGVAIMAEWAKKFGPRKSKEFENIEIRKNLPEGW